MCNHDSYISIIKHENLEYLTKCVKVLNIENCITMPNKKRKR